MGVLEFTGVGHCSVRRVVRSLGTEVINLLDIGVIHMDFGGASEGGAAGYHRPDGVTDATGWILVVIVNTYDVVFVADHIVESVALCTDIQFGVALFLHDIWHIRDEFADRFAPVVKDIPGQFGLWIILGFNTSAEPWDEAPAVISGGKKGDGGEIFILWETIAEISNINHCTGNRVYE